MCCILLKQQSESHTIHGVYLHNFQSSCWSQLKAYLQWRWPVSLSLPHPFLPIRKLSHQSFLLLLLLSLCVYWCTCKQQPGVECQDFAWFRHMLNFKKTLNVYHLFGFFWGGAVDTVHIYSSLSSSYAQGFQWIHFIFTIPRSHSCFLSSSFILSLSVLPPSLLSRLFC